MTIWDQNVLISPAIDFEVCQSTIDQSEPRPRLGIMASGSGSNFEAIVQATRSSQLQADIPLLIYNKPNALVADRAKRLEIPSVCLDHRDYESREALDGAIVAVLQEYDIDWVIMAGWMRIVTPVLIDAFPNRILNIHPSLLPSFKGGRAIEQAFESGVKITGCTVHYVVPDVDSGKIIMQAAVPVFEGDTLASLQARLQVQEHRIYPAAIAIAMGQRTKINQKS